MDGLFRIAGMRLDSWLVQTIRPFGMRRIWGLGTPQTLQNVGLCEASPVVPLRVVCLASLADTVDTSRFAQSTP